MRVVVGGSNVKIPKRKHDHFQPQCVSMAQCNATEYNNGNALEFDLTTVVNNFQQFNVQNERRRLKKIVKTNRHSTRTK